MSNLKEMVGKKAVEFIEDGMVVGLGTGTTAICMINELGKRVQNGLKITGVPTSFATREQAESLGIPVKTIDEVDHIDLTIDGADEISADFQGLKGGGAAHLIEKIIATNSCRIIWIVDDSKMVTKLGHFPLPVEVIPIGSQQVFRKFDAKGYAPTFRLNPDGTMLTTDMGHYLIDLHLDVIDRPHQLAEELDREIGVVEHGLFLDMVNTVIIGHEEGPEVIHCRE